VLIALLVVLTGYAREFDLLGRVQKLSQLRNRAQLRFIHVDHHPWMIKPTAQQ
jgi:hypothetical protein